MGYSSRTRQYLSPNSDTNVSLTDLDIKILDRKTGLFMYNFCALLAQQLLQE